MAEDLREYLIGCSFLFCQCFRDSKKYCTFFKKSIHKSIEAVMIFDWSQRFFKIFFSKGLCYFIAIVILNLVSPELKTFILCETSFGQQEGLLYKYWLITKKKSGTSTFDSNFDSFYKELNTFLSTYVLLRLHLQSTDPVKSSGRIAA